VLALAAIGLDRPVTVLGERGAAVERAEFCSYQRGVLATWPVAEIAAGLGAPTIGVSRDELHRILLDAAAACDVRLGAECRAITEGSTPSVVLTDGSTLKAELIIGADGLNSIVREHLFGAEQPRPAGYATWQAVVDHQDEAAPPGVFRVIWGPGARFLYYHLADGRLYWEGQFAAKPGGSDPRQGRKELVLRRFAPWGPVVTAMVAASDEASISRLDVHDRRPLRTWTRGPITLLGDAAHPMTNAIGQGANQSIEDAVVLAAVARTQPTWADALRAYERQRVPRTTAMVRTARNLQRFNRWQNPVACRLRDEIIRASFSTVGLRQHSRDMAVNFDMANSY
jgi:2-polyprenyl-6-methoxyphenol hydroxylase-like FAD-dependent oxidoreductase